MRDADSGQALKCRPAVPRAVASEPRLNLNCAKVKATDRVLEKATMRQEDRASPPVHEIVDFARCCVVFDHADACVDALESLASRLDVVWIDNRSEQLPGGA